MNVGTVERAFQLAPECDSVDEIRHKLKREGHSSVDEHVEGVLRRELVSRLRPKR
jgi:hypothetical protein